ncbi:MFS transporter [Salipaludibacillus sp. LMS25]|jgi:MFS family permease|uniref:MFS transporter n=1 Tax=Salipaludibacillus sp. LMS25 TaxID=2924031 RepID=UPI0020D1BB02|nr:MFS transporter [Salipaludibacillus sp. LMS25]UTR13425.1 MFS transporter [Salipaludibacillus sp. LMS25]
MSILNQRYSLFVLGTFLPKVADKVYLVAMPWLIFELTESSFYMGLMFLVETLPFILISPISGVIADKFSYIKTLYFTLFIQFFGLVSISTLLVFSADIIWLLYVLSFLICGAGASYWVVYNTTIPAIFKKEELVRANSLFQFSDTITIIIGASIAGFLITLIGIKPVFIIISACFLLTSLIIFFLSPFVKERNKKVNQKNSRLKDDFFEGLKYVIKHKPLFWITIMALIGNIGNGVLVSMLVFFIRSELKLGVIELNYIYIAGGISQIIALFLASYLFRKLESIKIMLFAQIICSFGILIIGLFSNIIYIIIGFAVQNAAVVLYNVTNRTFRQKIVPQELLGRVNGFNQMLVRSAFPLSGFVAGIIVTYLSVSNLYVATAILSFIVVIPFFITTFNKITDSEAQKMSHDILNESFIYPEEYTNTTK